MGMRVLGLAVALSVLGGCAAVTTTGPDAPDTAVLQQGPDAPGTLTVADFYEIVRIVEPVAERVCKARTTATNCDFRIVVDERSNLPPNAFQTVDKSGRPIVAFTQQLIKDAQNRDELAFVLGHEAAHHIRNHLDRQQQNAIAGAVIMGALTVLSGGTSDAVEVAQRQGAQVGARIYSKDFELEADALGTVIAAEAGFDPVRGAAYFTRIPDPGNRFLGTHPPNAQRIATVKRVAAGL